MPHKKSLLSLAFSLLPGLGQVYNGEILRGIVFFTGVLLSFAAATFGFLGVFGF